MPFTSLLIAIVIALLAVLKIRSGTGGRATSFYYMIVGLALLTFNAALIF
jgi:hypothetical protein